MSEHRFLGPFPAEVSEEEDARLQQIVEETERDLAERPKSEVRVFVRWNFEALGVIRRAAELSGVTYQTYVKQAAFRRAIRDLRHAASAGVGLATACPPNSSGETAPGHG